MNYGRKLCYIFDESMSKSTIFIAKSDHSPVSTLRFDRFRELAVSRSRRILRICPCAAPNVVCDEFICQTAVVLKRSSCNTSCTRIVSELNNTLVEVINWFKNSIGLFQVAIYFPTIRMINYYITLENGKISKDRAFLGGMFTGVVVWTAILPIDVVKTIIQTGRKITRVSS